MKPLILGLSSGSGTGKSTFSDIAKKLYNTEILDCDKIYHGLLETSDDLKLELESSFKSCFSNNKLDRKKLANIVFKSEDKLSLLNSITHPYVESEIERLLEVTDAKLVIIEAIALFESNLKDKCNYTISIIASIKDRLMRIMSRDNLTEKQAVKRLESQKSDEYFYKHSNYIINNDKTLDKFEINCTGLINSLYKNYYRLEV